MQVLGYKSPKRMNLMQLSQFVKCISMNQFQKTIDVKFYVRGQNAYSNNNLHVQQ